MEPEWRDEESHLLRSSEQYVARVGTPQRDSLINAFGATNTTGDRERVLAGGVIAGRWG